MWSCKSGQRLVWRTFPVGSSQRAVSGVYDWYPRKHILYSLGVKREREKREMRMKEREGMVGGGGAE